MAQTVAVQRGVGGALSANTTGTLFTQSGGNGTRVIAQQLLIGRNSSQLSSPRLTILYTPSGGYPSLIGYLKADTGSFYQWQVGPASNTGGVFTNIGNSTGTSFSDSLIGTTNVSGWAGTVELNAYNASGGSYNSYMPQQFWIGPSDSISIRCSQPLEFYAWSFTTITES